MIPDCRSTPHRAGRRDLIPLCMYRQLRDFDNGTSVKYCNIFLLSVEQGLTSKTSMCLDY